MAECEKDLFVRGYHAYHGIWKAVVGETLVCMREPQNVHDRYAIAVKKDGTVIGHLQEVFHVGSLLLKRGGSIHCTVTGKRRRSADLPQGGLEIPCFVVFKADPQEIQKLKRVLKHIDL